MNNNIIQHHLRQLSVAFVVALTCLVSAAPCLGQEQAAAAGAQAQTEQAESGSGFGQIIQDVQASIDGAFKTVVETVGPVLFVDVTGGMIQKPKLDDLGNSVLDAGGQVEMETVKIPLIVLFLLLGGIFFTFRFSFINIRLFAHSIQVLRGKYDDPTDHGEISHFKALTSALSATVGLGNIAGVAIAIGMGGAGAVFWMWVVAAFGMCSKFASCSLAQVYRRVSTEGGKQEHVLGGPMIYLAEGMKEVLGKGFGTPIGRILAISFSFFAILGALGGGNMFQANQTFEIVSYVALDGSKEYAWLAGCIMAVLVGLVIVGGIKRIGEVTCRIVPAMCAFYCLVCLVIVLANVGEVPALFASIFTEAFNFKSAGFGVFAGVMVIGVTRGAFSNEAGLGSAAIAHSAAKTKEPVREGIVAMIGPFIDTIVVCSMTALTILITKAHVVDETISSIASSDLRGAAMTAKAFATLHGWLPFLLCIVVFVFAYSTMISWCYYGERASEYLFGKKGIWPFRVVFLLFVVVGPMVSLSNVKDFTDVMILSMAYPNIIGVIILSPMLARLTKDYVRRLRSGEMKPYAQTVGADRDDDRSS